MLEILPLLWILPLGVYLVTFILCFDHSGWYKPAYYRWLLPLAIGGMLYGALNPTAMAGIAADVLLFLTGLFVCCMFCHGELSRRKPSSATPYCFLPDGFSWWSNRIGCSGAAGSAGLKLAGRISGSTGDLRPFRDDGVARRRLGPPHYSSRAVGRAGPVGVRGGAGLSGWRRQFLARSFYGSPVGVWQGPVNRALYHVLDTARFADFSTGLC